MTPLRLQMIMLGLQIVLCIFQLWLSHETTKSWEEMQEIDEQRQKDTTDLINAYLDKVRKDIEPKL